MDYSVYILGSSIIDKPSLWLLLGMFISFSCIVCLIVYTWYFSSGIPHWSLRNVTMLTVFGIIGIILIYYIFSLCEGKYHERLSINNPLKEEQISKKNLWRVEQDKDGNIYVYY